MVVLILYLISLFEFVTYVLLFKQVSHLLTIGLVLVLLTPGFGFMTMTVLLIVAFIAADPENPCLKIATLKDTKFNRWLFNHLNW